MERKVQQSTLNPRFNGLHTIMLQWLHDCETLARILWWWSQNWSMTWKRSNCDLHWLFWNPSLFSELTVLVYNKVKSSAEVSPMACGVESRILNDNRVRYEVAIYFRSTWFTPVKLHPLHYWQTSPPQHTTVHGKNCLCTVDYIFTFRCAAVHDACQHRWMNTTLFGKVYTVCLWGYIAYYCKNSATFTLVLNTLILSVVHKTFGSFSKI